MTEGPKALTEPGYYRLTAAGWERIEDAEAQRLLAEGQGLDVVHVEHDAKEEPLW